MGVAAPIDRLIAGRAFPHKVSAAEIFSTAAVTYAATNSVNYVAGSTSGTNLASGNVRFVEVANDHASAILLVTTGDSDAAPDTPTAGSGLRVYPASSRIFGFQGGGAKFIKVLTTVDTSTGGVFWIP